MIALDKLSNSQVFVRRSPQFCLKLVAIIEDLSLDVQRLELVISCHATYIQRVALETHILYIRSAFACTTNTVTAICLQRKSYANYCNTSWPDTKKRCN